jgi:hypothetical protein
MKRLGLFIVAGAFALSTMGCFGHHRWDGYQHHKCEREYHKCMSEHHKCVSQKASSPVKQDVKTPAKPAEETKK